MPLLSIITINFNNRIGLEKTIRSVASQLEKDLEFIIIDGGSADGSTEIIKENSQIISYFVSEKDNGIYDAQNKGIKAAKGDYLLFLNSGDSLFNENTIGHFKDFVRSNPNDIIYGNSNLQVPGKTDEVLIQPNQLDINYFFRKTLNHQATFIKKELFSQFGLYSTTYKICSDFEFFLKVFMKRPEAYKYFNEVICNYDNAGFSSDTLNYELSVNEKQSILKANLPVSSYNELHKAYRKEIPLKYRIFDEIYKVPVLNWMFKRVYSGYEIFKRK